MSIRAVRASADLLEPQSAQDRDVARLLALLADDRDGALTIAARAIRPLEGGIKR
jgi:hypothetical protein